MLLVAAALVAVLAGVVVADRTEASRSSGARAGLERAVVALERCHRGGKPFTQCRTGVTDVFMQSGRDSYVISASVHFGGPTYTLERSRRGALRRSCTPLGEGCPVGRWRARVGG